ncbi:hypothetical protein AB0I30_18710 [Nocardia tengchongensis]|uniref:hypothetical protein n=1 Tax=Nocardia tengchongensis TaxID=2055889 RepID=UPI0033D70E58
MGEMLRDRLVRNLVSALGGLPIAVQRRVSGRAPISIDGQTLHPEMQWALKLLTLLDDSDPELSVADSRIRIAALARAFSGRRVTVAEVEDLVIPAREASCVPAGTCRWNPPPRPRCWCTSTVAAG